ncbi:MAG: hypothetical protein PHD56_07990 [Anaerostipes sp.]|nr:hypothetical protein [Anaerostipes sp.]
MLNKMALKSLDKRKFLKAKIYFFLNYCIHMDDVSVTNLIVFLYMDGLINEEKILKKYKKIARNETVETVLAELYFSKKLFSKSLECYKRVKKLNNRNNNYKVDFNIALNYYCLKKYKECFNIIKEILISKKNQEIPIDEKNAILKIYLLSAKRLKKIVDVKKTLSDFIELKEIDSDIIKIYYIYKMYNSIVDYATTVVDDWIFSKDIYRLIYRACYATNRNDEANEIEIQRKEFMNQNDFYSEKEKKLYQNVFYSEIFGSHFEEKIRININVLMKHEATYRC